MTDITFPAQVVKVQTLADGGLRVTLDLPETAIFAAAQLMECKRIGVAGEVTFKAVVLTELDDETKKDAEGSGSEVDSRRIAIRRDKRTGR